MSATTETLVQIDRVKSKRTRPLQAAFVNTHPIQHFVPGHSYRTRSGRFDAHWETVPHAEWHVSPDRSLRT